MPDYQESIFRKRQKNKFVEYGNLQRDKGESFWGQDMALRNVEKTVSGSSIDIFKERYAEEKIPKEGLENRVSDTYTAARSNKTLSNMQKGKRAESAYRKIERQRNLLNEQKLFIKKRQDDKEFVLSMLTEEREKELSSRIGSEDEMNLLRNWGIMREEDDDYDELRLGISVGEVHNRNYIYYEICKEMDSDTTDYSYSSDDEFVSKFAQKYDAIVRYAATRYIINKYEEDPELSNKLSLSRLQAKVEYFEALKEDYEDRMELLSSPYYTLLSKKDIENLPADSDESMREYAALYRKLSENRFGKGRNKQKDLLALYKEKKKAMVKTDKKRFETVTEGMGINWKDKKTWSGKPGDDEEKKEQKETKKKDVIIKAFENKKKWIAAKYPNDDTAFLKEVRPDVGDYLAEGVDNASLLAYESKMLEILDKGTIDGQKLTKSHLTKIKKSVSDYVKARREHLSAMEAGYAVSYFVDGTGFDMLNPEFRKTEEYKNIMSLDGGGVPVSVEKLKSGLYNAYIESMYSVFCDIEKMGYKISQKYSEISSDKEKRILEDEKTNRKSQNMPEDFPRFTINGKKFISYERSNLSVDLAGKELKVNKKEEKKVFAAIEEYTELEKKELILNRAYFGNGGEKSLVYGVYKRNTAMRLEELSSIIKESVRGQLSADN